MSVLTDTSNFTQLFNIPAVVGLGQSAQSILDECVKVWAWKHPRNLLRSAYVDAHQRLQNAGITIPDQFKDLDLVIGWPEKAVYALGQRVMFDGLVSSSGTDDPFEIRSILDDNRFDIEFPEAVASALTHSCAFISVTRGDTTAGEPEVMVMHHSALWSSALWDRRRRALRAAFAVNSVDSSGFPTRVTLFTPEVTFVCVKGAAWYLEAQYANPLGRVPVEPLVYRPSLERPFGRSRVSRAVMSITDQAMRTVLRGETAEQLYAAMKIIVLGADEDAFKRPDGSTVPVWDWMMGRLNALSKDEEGDTPTIKTVSAQSPQPYIDRMRELAARFSGETAVPISSLGIVQDNPSSADAIYAAKEDLVIEATNADRVFGAGLARAFQDAVMLRDGLDELPDELRSLSVKWRNPALPSIVSQSAAMVQQISAIPWLADTTVALEELGYTEEQITRLLSEKQRAQTQSVLQQLLGGSNGDTGGRDSAGAGAAQDGEFGAASPVAAAGENGGAVG